MARETNTEAAKHQTWRRLLQLFVSDSHLYSLLLTGVAATAGC